MLGDAAAGALFGVRLSVIPLLLDWAFASATIQSPLCIAGGILLGAWAFSALGVLTAARPTSTPSEIMMLSNLVRLPLIFISGVFIPLTEMPSWGSGWRRSHPSRMPPTSSASA